MQAASATNPSKAATPAKVIGSVALTPKSRVDKSRAKPGAASTPTGDAHKPETRSLTQDEAQDIAALGAERNANAEFLRALGDARRRKCF